jgi:hypothetical protein
MDWKLAFYYTLSWLKGRLMERSTYLGLIGLAGSLGVAIEPGMAEMIVSITGGVVSLILVATKDSYGPKDEEEE